MVATLLLQAVLPSLESTPPTQAALTDFRYVRSLSLPKNASGAACTVLDASVYAHASSPSLDDLRVFRVAKDGKASGPPQEIPFVIRYSQAAPSDAQTATVRDLRQGRDELEFDLLMPARAYTQVDLDLAAENFIATASVTGFGGVRGAGGASATLRATPLGEFVLFDLTAQHLARSTSLALQESTFPRLHIRLRLRSPSGGAFPHLSTAVVRGATVPASRVAQTLYSVVASTSAVVQSGGTTVAQFHVPAHVPIEQVRFLLNPAGAAAQTGPGEFLRRVEVTAQAQRQTAGRQDGAPGEAEPVDDQAPLSSGDPAQPPPEVVSGEIWRVARPAVSGAPAVRAERLTLAAVLASNLHDPATVRVVVEDQGQTPLNIRSVQLEMRQRTLCFDASAGAAYTLRYGDPGLREDETGEVGGALASLPAEPMVATLGLEEVNSGYVRRPMKRTYDERNPDLHWVALLAAIAVLGTAVSRQATQQGRRR